MDGYSIARSTRGIRFKEAIMDVFRSEGKKEEAMWRKDVLVHRISNM